METIKLCCDGIGHPYYIGLIIKLALSCATLSYFYRVLFFKITALICAYYCKFTRTYIHRGQYDYLLLLSHVLRYSCYVLIKGKSRTV